MFAYFQENKTPKSRIGEISKNITPQTRIKLAGSDLIGGFVSYLDVFQTKTYSEQ